MLRSHQQATQYSAHQIKLPISSRTTLFKLNTKPGGSRLNKAVFLFCHEMLRCVKTGGQTPAVLHTFSILQVSEELFASRGSICHVFFFTDLTEERVQLSNTTETRIKGTYHCFNCTFKPINYYLYV